MSVGQPQDNEKNPIEYKSQLSDLSSFNAYGIVTLSDGQRVNTLMTMRHGIPLDKVYEDFQKWVAFLDKCATDSSVRFWDKEGEQKEEPKSTYTEPTYTQVDEGGGEVSTFPAGTLTVEYKHGKEYFKVTDASQKKTKFPVTVWPEVLEKAGIETKSIDPKTGKELTGWTAAYDKNEKGYPAKVTLLKQPDFVA